MKAATSLLTLLLVSQVLPWTAQPVHAQPANSPSLQNEDRSDGMRMQIDYNVAYNYAYSTIPAYSVEEVSEHTQVLADGNRISSKQSTMHYQDQDGRVRIEYKSYASKDRIFIADPRAKVAYLIRPDRKDVLRIKGEPGPLAMPRDRASLPTRTLGWSKQVMTSLGLKKFGDLTAAGILSETYYPAGSQGNDKEMVDTVEHWHSNQFPLALYSHSVSARSGETTVHLENLKYGDVPASLFALPVDYPVRDIVQEATPPADG